MSVATALAYWGKNTTPQQAAKYALENNFRYSEGTKINFFESYGNHHGLDAINLKGASSINWTYVTNALKGNIPVIVSGAGSKPYTTNGHYIVLTGITSDGKFKVNDSAGGSERDGKSYTASQIKSGLNNIVIFRSSH